jgi:hypothetical protein
MGRHRPDQRHQTTTVEADRNRWLVVAGALTVGHGCVDLLGWRIGVVRRAQLRGTPHGLTR